MIGLAIPGTAPLDGGEFGLFSLLLDSTLDSPYPRFGSELALLPISSSEVLYGPSCVRGPACGLSPPLSSAALAS